MASGEANEPVVILTPSLVMSRSVSLMAAVGLVASPCRYSILRPLTPPRSLIMSRAICIASQFSMPFFAKGPVNGSSTPIWMLLLCASAVWQAATTNTAPIAAATIRFQNFISSLLQGIEQRQKANKLNTKQQRVAALIEVNRFVGTRARRNAIEPSTNRKQASAPTLVV